MTAYGQDVAIVTATGPGRDVLGSQEAIWQWNGSAPGRWRRLHRAASQIARRRHGRFTLIAASWEYQRRGVLHRHVVVGLGSAREIAAAHTYVQALHELREQFGFGFIDRGRRRGGRRQLEVIPALRAGRYLAKYLAPIGEGGKLVLSETVTRPDVPAIVVYVTPAMTKQTNCTMRELRRIRWVYVQARRLGLDREAVHELVGQGVDVNALQPMRGP